MFFEIIIKSIWTSLMILIKSGETEKKRPELPSMKIEIILS
jgi:hypothetical protein